MRFRFRDGRTGSLSPFGRPRPSDHEATSPGDVYEATSPGACKAAASFFAADLIEFIDATPAPMPAPDPMPEPDPVPADEEPES